MPDVATSASMATFAAVAAIVTPAVPVTAPLTSMPTPSTVSLLAKLTVPPATIEAGAAAISISPVTPLTATFPEVSNAPVVNNSVIASVIVNEPISAARRVISPTAASDATRVNP